MVAAGNRIVYEAAYVAFHPIFSRDLNHLQAKVKGYKALYLSNHSSMAEHSTQSYRKDVGSQSALQLPDFSCDTVFYYLLYYSIH